MSDDTSPIDSPHPGLTDPGRKADRPVLLYKGSLKGRWTDTEALRAHFSGPEDAIRDIVKELSEGLEGDSEVRLALSPSPHISWIFRTNIWPDQAGWPVLVPPTELSSNFTTRSGTDALPAPPEHTYSRAGTSRLILPVKIGDPDSLLDEIRFYLINFQVMQLVGDVHREGKRDPSARLSLRANGWRIEVERRPEYFESSIHLEERSGYAVTHNCRIWQEDDRGTKKTFIYKDAESVLETVQLFASFVRGGMVGVALPVGYQNGNAEFEQWSVTPVDPGQYPDPHRMRFFPGWYLWFDHPVFKREAATWLSPMFSQFAAIWWHPDDQLRKLWRSVFRGLIFTYTDAERMDQSRAIVPACTALETLAWAILVVKEKWLTGDKHPGGSGYEKLTAADHLRLLLRWAGLPAETPSSLSELTRKVKQSGGNWDGPQMVTWVRNRVVHPDRRDQLENEIATEAWLLAMWYMELVTLRLLAYDGYFRDRLDDGKIKRVPWATASSGPE